MATVADALAISIGLDATKFNKGHREVAAAMKRTREGAVKEGKAIERSMDGAAESVDRLIRNAVKLFAVFTAGRAVKDFASDITRADAALGRLSKSLGTTPETISALGNAVARNGGSADAAAGSFQRLSDSINELRTTGNTSALPIFAKLQASSGRQIRLNQDLIGTFGDLADAAKGTAERQGVPMATYLLRQAGVDEGTAALLVQGRGKLMEAMRRSGSLGLVRKEDTEAAQRLQTSIETLRQTSEGLGRSIMTVVTPVIVDAVGAMQRWIDANRAWLQTEIVDRIKAFADYLRSIDWKGIEDGIKGFVVGANDAAKAIGGWKVAAEAFFGLWAASKIAGIFAPLISTLGVVRAMLGLNPIGLGILGTGVIGGLLAEYAPKGIVSGGRPSGTLNPSDELPGLDRGGAGIRRRGGRAKHVDGPLTQNYPAGLADGIRQSAKDLGISPRDLATAISYETGGTFDPWKSGPTTKWGRHRGLIQWGEPQRAQYGVTQGMTPGDQMKSVTRYLRDAGVRPGMGLPEIYSAINAGKVGRMGWSDRPGFTVQRHVNEMRGPHGRNADRLLDAGTTAKPSAWNGIPNAAGAVAQVQAAQAARYSTTTSTSNDNSSETHFHGDWHIQTAATDGAGLATDLRKSLGNRAFAMAANTGQA